MFGREREAPEVVQGADVTAVADAGGGEPGGVVGGPQRPGHGRPQGVQLQGLEFAPGHGFRLFIPILVTHRFVCPL